MKQTKCLKCPSKAHYNGLCRKHFMEQIIRRVRKEIREKGLIKKDDVLAAKDPICRLFIKKCMAGMPLKIIKNERKNAKVVLPWTLDDEVLSFLAGFFSGKNAQEKALEHETPRIEIKPFRNVKEDELAAFARLAKIRFKRKKRPKDEEEMKKWLEKMEKRHPETRFSLLKGVEEIKRLQ